MLRSHRSRLAAALAGTAMTAMVGLGVVAASAGANVQPPSASSNTNATVVGVPTPQAAKHADLAVSDVQMLGEGGPFVVVSNYGEATASNFRIAVFASAQSRSVNVASLKPHSMMVVNLSFLSCGQLAAILVDPEHKTSDVDHSNNATSFTTPCLIDHGSVGNPVSEG